MSEVPIAANALRLLVAVSFVVQIGLLAAAPLPSPVATHRVVRWRRSAEGSASKDRPLPDSRVALLLPLGALLGVIVVMAAAVYPPLVNGLVPKGATIPSWLGAAGGACLLAGNLLVAAAALTLKGRTRFDAGGQSDVLVTGGIFGLTRHPIAVGLGVIYLGFFLALPSPLVLVGLMGYLFHQKRRLEAEEGLLEKRFGHAYRDYRQRVGLFGPRWPSRG
jgi:protein-S-isoprenylcysteine O-methyltransferase Ste14